MAEERDIKQSHEGNAFSRQIGAKAARKLKARSGSKHGVWLGLGMMGLIGWSIVIPTLLGTALGVWLDHRDPNRRSWTLMLLVAGLIIGCWNAWQWVAREEQEMREEQEGGDE